MNFFSKPRYHGPISPYFDGKRFMSPYIKTFGLRDFLKWKLLGEKAVQWPRYHHFDSKESPRLLPSQKAAVSFINHSTVLMQTHDLTLITDPVFSQRVSPFSWIGPKRVSSPGISIEKLPHIDVVVISHNHYDHLDLVSLQQLKDLFDPMFLVPLGDGQIIKSISGIRFQEMDWWQSINIKASTLHFLPAQHWSARSINDRNLSLWGSYLIEAPDFNTYFAGDTGYACHFQEIAARFTKIDLALLPIGAYKPRWFMKPQHMNPYEAVQAHLDLKAEKSMGIHFGTWQLTDEGIDEPIMLLKQARQDHHVVPEDFFTLHHGETYFT